MKQGPLGPHHRSRRCMVKPAKQRPYELIIPSSFDPQGPLTDRRQTDLWGKILGNLIFPAQPAKSSRSEHDGIELAFAQFPEPRIQIPPQHHNGQIRSGLQQLRLAPQTARTDLRPMREIFEVPSIATNEGIPRILATWNAQ